MQFKPRTEEELAGADELLEAGKYSFVIAKSTEKTSKKGNPMIEIELEIDDKGHSVYVRDWLLAEPRLSAAKLRHFCDTAGLLTAYEHGELSANACWNKTGEARIGIEGGGQVGSEYPPKNVVLDYVLRPARPIATTPQQEEDLPF